MRRIYIPYDENIASREGISLLSTEEKVNGCIFCLSANSVKISFLQKYVTINFSD